MGSMFGRSVMEKNSTDACAAIGLYPRLDSLILASVSSATYSLIKTIHTVPHKQKDKNTKKKETWKHG